MQQTDRTTIFTQIARPGGGFAMVANDGRESFRGLLHRAGRPHEDHDLAAGKAQIARHLAPVASAMLCDTVYGREAISVIQGLKDRGGLIIAVDRFEEDWLGPLRATYIDVDAVSYAAQLEGVAALKHYVFWRADESAQARRADVQAFIDACAQLGVLSVLEGVVTTNPADPLFDDHLVEAAREFGAFAPDVYKTQVPAQHHLDLARVAGESARISDAVGVPWVALSNGVAAERFGEAIAAVCEGGASGFLAGRGAWKSAMQSGDPETALATDAVAGLKQLAAIVDRHARPWHAVVPGAA